ncbi:SMI1/KNR4 family protein [Undibacterium sp.]|uniref:SMI1/KNR4 family protein n=1 Tax=Undibacterium sp. TaxID=1914977 RepID=UPI002730047F|nr:SMI1/KNR4 family protein [Undibacterium sp.]MDP1979215.1 SMI1/KNR4 family protein [Undibacterium sp.]
MSIFDKLQKYIGSSVGSKRFMSVDVADINAAEAEFGFKLPSSLKRFYQSVGYGWFGVEDRSDIRNLFVHPLDMVDLYNGTSEFSPPEEFLPGDVPFFDCGSFRFLVFRPSSSNSEFVYRHIGESEPIANDIEDFVEKLLLNPHFYEE